MVTQSPSEATDRKTGRPDDQQKPAWEFVERDGQRVLVIRSFDLARGVLRMADGTCQAGFNADLVVRSSAVFAVPMLYTEGNRHREQRRYAGRHFTPKTVTARHRAAIERIVDDQVAAFERDGGGRLDLAAFRVAMRVVAEVVGLTHSDLPAMERLLETFFDVPPPAAAPRWVRWRHELGQQIATVRFHLRHVRPAIAAHRAEPRDDVLGGLLDQGLRERDILIEALTYAAAGMVTTRQLMTISAWHLIERPTLRERFLSGSDDERRAVLHEMIRLETVAGHLLRRTTRGLRLDGADGPVEIPEGTLIDLQIQSANVDPEVFGADAMKLVPGRCPVSPSGGRAAGPQGLSFGAGHHACPGEYLALEETDVFLRRFFRRDWSLESSPTVDWNDVLLAYDIRDVVVRPT